MEAKLLMAGREKGSWAGLGLSLFHFLFALPFVWALHSAPHSPHVWDVCISKCI